MAKVKTNAMRMLDSANIDYKVHEYSVTDDRVDGKSVAAKIGQSSVFKTLVAQGKSKGIYVFVILVDDELDLKKAAEAAGEKKVEMLPVKDLQKYTGYIRGGCSPLGMKKTYPAYLDSSAQHLDTIIVSAGKIGYQIEVNPIALADVIGASFKELKK